MSTEKFALRKGNQFLNASDEFESPALYHADTVRFDTEESALDKAVALGLQLDSVKSIRIKTRED